jgi:glycosyltransferase involved in cell wall biosynthesis
MLKLGLPAPRRLRNLWQIDRPDLVHIATEGPLGYSALWAARALSIPVSSTFHTNFHSYSRHYGFPFLGRTALAYLRHFHNRTRVTLSPSADLNASLTRDGFQNVRLFSRGVDTQVFSPAQRRDTLRARLGVTSDDLLVIHVSRLAREKNYGLLFRAFEAIRAVQPRARFLVASDGPLRRRLEKKASYAHFTGFLPREELAAHYASADLFLYPSLTETFGNVVPEAMASGLPVVAFKYAAAGRYIAHNEHGWVAPVDDETSFIEGAVHLASSPELRARLGQAARAVACTISWERVIDGLEQDLLQVIQGAPDRSRAAPSNSLR